MVKTTWSLLQYGGLRRVADQLTDSIRINGTKTKIGNMTQAERTIVGYSMLVCTIHPMIMDMVRAQKGAGLCCIDVCI